MERELESSQIDSIHDSATETHRLITQLLIEPTRYLEALQVCPDS